MNLANFFSLLRAALVIPVVWFYMEGWISLSFLIFVFAAFTDYLDGFFARKKNQVTDFGKVFDQVSDKILVISTAVAMLDVLPLWYVLVVFARDTFINGLRILAASRGNVVPARWIGKAKTVSQFVVLIAAYLFKMGFLSNALLMFFVVLSLTVTVISWITYTIDIARITKLEG
ncbi:CDP-diacylglycerol/glycerol-3-phosphate 3-phosphatidyltransferase [Thermotoga petrophila RKU-10]|uniref:CDP-diacylglycerol/glycerol-3-phosphate 3-phosphatidyltransferase n=1 Tax=Thermotoga petrophila (strain ATCC BAA-489 / DSM 13996 / JCM 10882 / RKU-10) TaxID=590168 RepID=D2C6X8_THEP2|nr:CDP-alcohol phosphatidyltransferase family protein [Thermotoga petrophila]ADA66714.1 CDP-diacylglycerol/glycerol-3-phosphate 3-phosphatidyltransferase [Thermotoga petrophila RKU-10]